MPHSVKWPFPKGYETSRLWHISSKLTIALVGSCSKIMSEWLNTTEVHNFEFFKKIVERRPKALPLVTVCNHHSCLDDPILFGVLRWRYMITNSHLMRWTLAASDICFTNQFHAWFFAHGRCVPVIRGAGIYQKSLDFMIDKLNKGEWVHMFPEGLVNDSKAYKRIKWGVGRIIHEASVVPLVVPIWHIGMDDILPNKQPYIPRVGKKVTLNIGEPIHLGDFIADLEKANKTKREIRKAITDKIEEELYILKAATEKIHFKATKVP